MRLEQSRRSYELKNLTNDELTIEIEKILRVEIPDLEDVKLKALAEKISMEAREFKNNPRNIGGVKATKYPFISRKWNSERREFENSVTTIDDLSVFVINMAVKEFPPRPKIDQGGVDQGVWRFEV